MQILNAFVRQVIIRFQELKAAPNAISLAKLAVAQIKTSACLAILQHPIEFFLVQTEHVHAKLDFTIMVYYRVILVITVALLVRMEINRLIA